jgi:predicted nuclease of predicted toxin-antitoxin system
VAPRFLIDENLSPLLARHLRTAHGFDAVHVQELGLRGASDADILGHAIAEDRIIMTSNADDFRTLGARAPAHPELAVILDAVGRARQLTLGVGRANAIDRFGPAHGRLFEIDRTGAVRDYQLPVSTRTHRASDENFSLTG